MNLELDRIVENPYSMGPIMNKLNSGIRNCHNFFLRANFLFPRVGNESVNYADSGDINFGPIPWESGFEICHEFLKMRGWHSYA